MAPCVNPSNQIKVLEACLASKNVSKNAEITQSMPSMYFTTKNLSHLTVASSLLKMSFDVGSIKKLGEVYDICIVENDFRMPQKIVARTTQNYKVTIHWNKLFTPDPICTIDLIKDTPRASSHKITCIDKSNKWHVEMHNRNAQGEPLEFIALKVYQNVLRESEHRLSVLKCLNHVNNK